MIEINLLPGADARAQAAAGSKIDFAGVDFGHRSAKRIREPWLIGVVARSRSLALAVVGVLYMQQRSANRRSRRRCRRRCRTPRATPSVLREHDKAEAQRDTVLRSLNLIRAIDDDRFIWPHVMDEVSRALPPYTWIVSLGFIGHGQAQAPVTTIAPPPNGARPAGAEEAPCPQHEGPARHGARAPRRQHRRHPVAHTLHRSSSRRRRSSSRSSSAKSERANDNGKEVTQFQLDMLYSRPDPAMMKRVPLAVSVR